ncbi:MAG: heme biosynthesis HemY N-terminal domain-containing protein [Gammaproteobacteria bacterium]|jgi:HemY protein
MRWLLFTLLTITVVVVLTLLAMQDRGYVLINIRGYTIESTLVTWLVLIGLAFVAFYYVLRFFINVFHAPRGMKQWRRQRRQHIANQGLLDGLVKLAEGDWKHAEKQVLRHIDDSQVPLLHYLAAARAAHELKQYDRRDRYLNLAGQNAPTTDVGVKLTQAELQLSQHHQEQALATLRTLQQVNPRHPTVLKTLARLYIDLGDWKNFVDLIPRLRKLKLYNDEELDKLERHAYLELLTGDPDIDAKQLGELWYRVPQRVQANHDVLINYIHRLLALNNSDIAEPLIRNALKQQWNDELVRLYGIIDAPDVRSQLEHAEHWLQQKEHDAVLLLTLGRLSLKNQLWGKARHYFEASIGANGPLEAYHELGRLLDTLGEKDLAMQYYRDGLAKAPQCAYSVVTNARPLELEHQSSDRQRFIGVQS